MNKTFGDEGCRTPRCLASDKLGGAARGELTSLVLWGYQQGSDVSDACSRQEHEIHSQRKKKSPLCHWLSGVCLSKLHHLGVAFFLSDFCLVWFGVVLL